MAQSLEELPLFPLDTVVFPFSEIQLHIFEPRYREMIQHCLEFEIPFGIVLIREGSEVGGTAEPYMVGTVCRIVESIRHSDGRFDIKVRGERRFRVRKVDESKPYLTGLVEPVIEHVPEDQDRLDVLVSRAREEFSAYVSHIFAHADASVQVTFPSDPIAVSFMVANYLRMPLLRKQRLLEITETIERLEEVLHVLEHQLLESHLEEPDPTRPYRLSSGHLADWINSN